MTPDEYFESAKTIEGEVVTGGAPKVEEPVSAPAVSVPQHRLMVFYEFIRKDGSTHHTRIFVSGMVDIRTEEQVKALEAHIVELSNGEYLQVQITNWKKLEG